MKIQRRLNGKVIELDQINPYDKGGEADIFLLPDDPSLAVKIYHAPSDERASKLLLMAQFPPDDPSLAIGHTSIAWPTDLINLPGKPNEIVGFVMPRLQGMSPVSDFYNPVKRGQLCPLFSYRYLLQAARNIAMTVSALHRKDYVIGDLNDRNILVGTNALISFVDTDSFQVQDAKLNRTYRCLVGSPDFTPPELQGRNFEHRDRVIAHDHFGLAVLLFQILMEGYHPYDGIYQGKGGSPSRADRIAVGHFTYGKYKVPYSLRSDSPSFEMLHPELQTLFLRAFEEGDSNPQARPLASEWQTALETATKSLATCPDNSQHLYSSHLQSCPWCARTQQLRGADPFPSIESVRGGEHLLAPTAIKLSLPPDLQEYAGFSSPANSGFNMASIPFPPDENSEGFQKPKRGRWLAIGGACILSIGGVLGWAATHLHPSEAESKVLINEKILAPTNAEELGKTEMNPEDHQEIVWVPAGEFTMGTSETELNDIVKSNSGLKPESMENETPQHRVFLNGYYIYKNLISVKAFKKFCEIKGFAMPPAPQNNIGWKNNKMPIENVSWEQANAYCKWVGGHLPTEAQWEKAARGVDLRRYPWGYQWNETKCSHSKRKYGDKGGSSPIGKFPDGASPCGALDMSGNVWQWCRDWYGTDYYKTSVKKEPGGPESGNNHVLRGGSWCDTEPTRFRTAFRYGTHDTNLQTPTGFRPVIIPKTPSTLVTTQGM